MKQAAISLALLSLSLAAAAGEPEAYAYVSALQPPVWVEQDGKRTALPVSAPLRPGQRYITGSGARLHAALADGSIVKLGENAEFELPALHIRQEAGDSVLSGGLKIVKGAFRYTTQALNFIRRRELDVTVGPTITIGIRGTDIWGKSEPSQELVCLLSGTIKVRSPGLPEQTMDQANSFYVVPRGQRPLPVAAVPAEKLKTWMPQTELAAGQPALQSNGPYRVVLAVYLDEAQARRRVEEYTGKGYPATLQRREYDHTPVFSVIIDGLSSAADATAYAAILKDRLFLKNPRIAGPGA